MTCFILDRVASVRWEDIFSVVLMIICQEVSVCPHGRFPGVVMQILTLQAGPALGVTPDFRLEL
jgi:hypothetical protein